MKGDNIIHGPVLQTPSGGMVYSVTLLSGHIVTNPMGFGVSIEPIVPTDICPTDSTRQLEDYEPGATQTQVLAALKKVVTSPKSSRKHPEPPAATS